MTIKGKLPSLFLEETDFSLLDLWDKKAMGEATRKIASIIVVIFLWISIQNLKIKSGQ